MNESINLPNLADICNRFEWFQPSNYNGLHVFRLILNEKIIKEVGEGVKIPRSIDIAIIRKDFYLVFCFNGAWPHTYRLFTPFSHFGFYIDIVSGQELFEDAEHLVAFQILVVDVAVEDSHRQMG